jgi:WD40 repeat protein
MPRLNKRPRHVALLAESWRTSIADHVSALEWSPDAHWLSAAAISGPVTLFDGSTGEARASCSGHDLGTTSLSWNSEGTILASAGQDGFIRLWNAAQLQARQALAAGAPWVERVAWSPDGRYIAGAAGRRLRLWDVDGQLVRDYPEHPSTILDIQWKPHTKRATDGPPILTSAAYGRIAVWSPESAEPLRSLAWKGSILVIAWSPNGKYIASGDQDATVHFWMVESGTDLQMWGYPTKVRELAWDSRSRYLATGGGPTVIVWDCSGKGPEGTKPLMLNAHEDFLSGLAFQHRGPLLASAGLDGRVVLWHPGQHKQPVAQGMIETGIARLAWSPDDRRLAAGSDDGTVIVYTVGSLGKR